MVRTVQGTVPVPALRHCYEAAICALPPVPYCAVGRLRTVPFQRRHKVTHDVVRGANMMQPAEVTASVAVFLALARAHSAAVSAGQRSGDDKEFAAEDWVVHAARAAGLEPVPQGRHAPVDFTVETVVGPAGDDLPGGGGGGPTASVPVQLALQAKGLTSTAGSRVRSDLDYNGTLPQPRHDGTAVLLVYTELDRVDGIRRAQSVVVADMALVQQDPHDARSSSVKGYGSFGDVAVRMRLMYVGAQPVALAAQQGLDVAGCATLMLSHGALTEQAASEHRLVRAGILRRTYSTRRLASVNFPLDGSDPQPVWEAAPARPDRLFDVWSVDPDHAGNPARAVAGPAVPRAMPARGEQLSLDL